MKNLKHTPGPWIYEKRAFGSRVTSPRMDVHYPNGDIPCIARVFRHKAAKKIKCYNDDDEAEANGVLIAAAPEMLDALIAAAKRERITVGGIHPRTVDAIEHATGMTINEVLQW